MPMILGRNSFQLRESPNKYSLYRWSTHRHAKVGGRNSAPCFSKGDGFSTNTTNNYDGVEGMKASWNAFIITIGINTEELLVSRWLKLVLTLCRNRPSRFHVKEGGWSASCIVYELKRLRFGCSNAC
jgi:hypothetical protein